MCGKSDATHICLEICTNSWDSLFCHIHLFFFLFSSNAFSESTYDFVFGILYQISQDMGSTEFVDNPFTKFRIFFLSNHSHLFINPKTVIEVTDFWKIADVVKYELGLL